MSKTMPRSNAYKDFLLNRREVLELLHVAPTESEQLRSRKQLALANALFRGSVVLLSSHLEGYCEQVTVEGIDAINVAKPIVDKLPEQLRLAQTKQLLRDAHESTNFKKKIKAIRQFAVDYPGLWDSKLPFVQLTSDPLVRTFANPAPEKITRLFKHFGDTDDVVQIAVRMDKSNHRFIIIAKVAELIEKRNAIAHGTLINLTRQDINTYQICALKLVCRLDIVVGKQIQKMTGHWPWH